ncbi:hypothetical protein ACF0H5_008287 [Mactra antiquata]
MTKSDSRALYEMKLTTGMAFIYGPEGRKAHAQAIEEDQDKSYRMVVNVVGKVRQGKTSLRRLLVGEEFNEREESTVGIEHEFVETLGTTPNTGISKFWTKIDMNKANVEECDMIVGKHVRERLQKKERGEKHKAEVKSFLKAIVLSYVMIWLYFTLAEIPPLAAFPWFPLMLVVSLVFSGVFLFDTMRDGFGMAIGTMCLVMYCDAMLRWNTFNNLSKFYKNSCRLLPLLYSFLSFSSIHCVMGFSMGISTAMGFCFVLGAMKPPWESSILSRNVLHEPQLHVFTMSTLVGIWTVRHPKLIACTVVIMASLWFFIPELFIYTSVAGLVCGYSHAISIKLGFSAYVKLLNPFFLKRVSNTRSGRRLVCYSLGIIPGLFIVNVLGWKFAPRPVSYILCAAIVPTFVELCHFVFEGKTEATPKAVIKNATKVLDANSEASLKFVIRDFAGHPLYHSVHHIYMMGHCVYIICFNFVEAKRNFRVAFAEILYWLQAIFVHDRYPSVRAFIVGTHRDDKSLSKEDLEDVCQSIMNQLPRQFHNMVVWNEDRPVFMVENSLRNESDPDHEILRSRMVELANGSMKPTYPIKYLYFYRVINECRDTNKLILTLDEIEALSESKECVLDKPGELEDMLTYFHENGEIIYNSYDNNQNQLVVLDPKALVNIIVSLVRPPPRSERRAEFMHAWHTVAELGIASKRLLYHIIEQSSLVSEEVSTKVVIQLLEYLDLVCKLDLGIDGRDALGEKCYLIAPLLKDTLPYPQNYFEDLDSDTIVYIDFGPVVPKFVFTRLACQCTSESHIEIGTDGSFHLNVSTSKALFTYRDSHSFKLELSELSENKSAAQQLLKIVVRGMDQQGCLSLTRKICQKVCNIVERDFRKCRYKIGVMCPFNGPHDFCQYGEQHIFSLYENIKPDGPMNHRRRLVYLPEHKEFWCRGKQFDFVLGQVKVKRLPGQESRVVRQRSSLWDVNVLDLPPRLFSDICDDLNLFNALGRDWRQLADELGRSVRDIEILRFRSPRDPCDALLQDWGATTENATVSTLVEKLRNMERVDVVKRIEDYINGSG